MAQLETVETPDGPFTVIADDSALLAAGWTSDPAHLLRLIHPSLQPTCFESGGSHLGEAIILLQAYYDGDRTAPARAVVRQLAGTFRMHAWEVLREVAPGAPITYSQLAASAGNPKAVRAAGSACARNAVALFVPCHRVVRSDGSPGGFGYGVPIKRALLEREGLRPPERCTPTIGH